MDLTLMTARVLPAEVNAELEFIATEAIEAAYATIHDRLASLGYPCSGDVAPDEDASLMRAFRLMVRSVALNNPQIAAMDDDSDDEGEV